MIIALVKHIRWMVAEAGSDPEATVPAIMKRVA
jgi:hypothetical protein